MSLKVKDTPWLFAALLIAKVFGVFFATMVFARYSPLVDSQLYLGGYYATAGEYRTLFVQWFATEFNNFGGAFFAHFLFALFSVAGLIYYYATGGRQWVLVPLLLFPSSMVWTSIVGKEAIYCGGLGLALVVWSKYTCQPLRLREVMVATVSLAICFLFRPHYAIAILWLFVATFVIKHFGKKAFFILLSILFLGAVAVYFLVWEELLFRGYSGIEATARASRFNSFGIVAKTLEGFQQFKLIVPLGVVIGIIGPLPSEIFQRVEFVPFFVEGVMILLSPLLIYRLINKNDISNRVGFARMFWWCLMPGILISMVMHAPFGLLNPGSATRWRTNFEQLFYLAPLLLAYRFKDDAA